MSRNEIIFSIIGFGSIIALFCGLFYFCCVRPDNDDEPQDILDVHHSAAMNNIAQKCGVKNDDYLYTTAMQKISDCVDRLSVPKITRITSVPAFLIGKYPYYFEASNILPQEPNECRSWCQS